jgi:hypothetical protein
METAEMAGITRINLLYNTKERPATKKRRGTPERSGRLGISRSTFHDNFVLHSAADPYVPNTNVPRLKLLHLAPNAAAAFNDDIDALEEGLRRWRDKTFAERKGSAA